MTGKQLSLGLVGLSSAKMDFRILNSVDALGKPFFDSVTADPHCTYEWFRTVEEAWKQEIYYVAVYRGEEPVAVTPCFVDVKDNYFGNTPKLIPFLHKMLVAGSLLNLYNPHVLLCHSLAGCWRSSVLLDGDHDEKEVMDKMSEGIDRLCRLKRAAISCFICVPESEKSLVNSLDQFGYRKYQWKKTYSIRIRWSSFDQYLMSLNCKTRKNIKRELRQCSMNGVEISVVSDFGELSQVLSDLYLNLYCKYYSPDSPYFQYPYYDASFFSSLSRYGADKVVLFVASKNGKVVGFTLCMREKEVLEGFKCGFDYSACAKNDYAYFNLLFYAPINWAIENGVKEVYYGTGMGESKMKRGCRPYGSYCFVKTHDGLLSSLVSLYNAVPTALKRKLTGGAEFSAYSNAESY